MTIELLVSDNDDGDYDYLGDMALFTQTPLYKRDLKDEYRQDESVMISRKSHG